MKDYYGFDGEKLVYIGKFKEINEALEESQNQAEHRREFFYVTDIVSWSLMAKEIITTITSHL